MFSVVCFDFGLSIFVPRGTALGSATTGALLLIDVYNYDPWPQDVELDLSTLHGLAGFAPAVTLPHVEPSIPQVMPPMVGYRISLPIQANAGGHSGTEVFKCGSLRYRVSGMAGWSGWHSIMAGNTASVLVI
jgi:hypothetical protein